MVPHMVDWNSLWPDIPLNDINTAQTHSNAIKLFYTSRLSRDTKFNMCEYTDYEYELWNIVCKAKNDQAVWQA
jgi:hypothetical protein